MLETLLTAIIPTLLFSTVSSYVTFRTTKGKYLAETASIEQQNVQLILQTYKTALDDMKLRLEQKIEDFRRRKEEYRLRETNFNDLQKKYVDQIVDYEKRIHRLEIRLEKLISQVCTRVVCEHRIYPPIED